MAELLDEIRRVTTGRYLTAEEYRTLESSDRFLAPRIRAARNAEAKESAIVKATVSTILGKFDFASGRGGFGHDKCYRDVSTVYRHCVFAMLCDDLPMLENKLLIWLRTILQSLSFPGETESISATYTLLRKEVNRQLSKEDAALLDPFFQATAEVLSQK